MIFDGMTRQRTGVKSAKPGLFMACTEWAVLFGPRFTLRVPLRCLPKVTFSNDVDKFAANSGGRPEDAAVSIDFHPLSPFPVRGIRAAEKRKTRCELRLADELGKRDADEV